MCGCLEQRVTNNEVLTRTSRVTKKKKKKEKTHAALKICNSHSFDVTICQHRICVIQQRVNISFDQSYFKPMFHGKFCYYIVCEAITNKFN